MKQDNFAAYSDTFTANRAAAAFVAEQLIRAIAERGRASLVVSGGRLASTFFYELSGIELRWSAVTVTLADERCVPPHHSDSNERLVREHLLTWLASSAQFVPVWDATSPGNAASAATSRLASVPAPFDVVVLGMGEDGHTASLFPDNPQLAWALDPSAARGFVYVESPNATHPRLTLNAPALRDARTLVLLMNGESKRAVYRRALQPGPVAELPIRLALHHPTVPCHVFWSA